MGLKIATCVRTTARDEDSTRNSETPNRKFSNELLEDPVTPRVTPNREDSTRNSETPNRKFSNELLEDPVTPRATPNRVFSSGVLKDSETPNRLFSNELLEDSEVPTNHDEVLEDLVTPNLLSLPNEILVKIMSYLPDARDRVKFRYVSRRWRNISETPSLFCEFMWPDCNHHEERCLYNVMKDYGVHIRRLSFPQQVICPCRLPNTENQVILKLLQMAEMLQFCSNLTHLSLPALDHSNSSSDDSGEQLRRSIQEMKHLEVLTIHCYTSVKPYLSLKTALKELTIYTVIRSKEGIEVFRDWMMNGFNPPKLNIILCSNSMDVALRTFRNVLMPVWSTWNSQIPAGHFACLKVYINYKVPLNLFQNAPAFQLQYGELFTLPVVHVGTWLLLTDHGDADNSRVVHKAEYYSWTGMQYHVFQGLRQDFVLQLDNIVTSLTELDLSGYPCNLVQMIVACPLLRRLNLKDNMALGLQDLQMIANCCLNLEGLNLTNVPIPCFTSSDSLIDVWEILSNMKKLAYLTMDARYLVSCFSDVPQELESLFEKCTTLRALELSKAGFTNHYELLSHFPSLEYCRLTSSSMKCVQNILTACKGLKYFCCDTGPPQSLLRQAHVNNLQQLCILSGCTDLDFKFMEAVSAHGGLIHVVFKVKSVNFNGIITLINNSPNLLTCLFGLPEKKQQYCKWLNTELAERFGRRKLFISVQPANCRRVVEDLEWLQNTDLLTLWPLEEFIYR